MSIIIYATYKQQEIRMRKIYKLSKEYITPNKDRRGPYEMAKNQVSKNNINLS